MSDQQYYISTGGYSGNSLIFWGKDSRGYTSNLDNAGLYSEEDAKRICSNSDRTEKAWPKEYIEGITNRAVSCENIDWKAFKDFKKTKS